MQTIAYISLRGGSKGIPKKNIKPICGKPLFVWSMEAAKGCDNIDHVYLITDDDEIEREASRYDCGRVSVVRVPTIADTDLQEVQMVPFAESRDFKTIVLLQATQPLTTSSQLSQAITRYKAKNPASMVSVCRQHRFEWKTEWGCSWSPAYVFDARPRRQDWAGVLIENGAFFITSREALLSSKSRLSGQVDLYEMPGYTYFEIDDETDWVIMEQLLERQMRGHHG